MRSFLLDVNNFGPFHFEVWGNFADWILVLVTGITAFFLWKTLQSQKDVQNAQNVLLEIEQKRFKLEIRPVAEFKTDWDRKCIEVCVRDHDMVNAVFNLIEAHPTFQDKNGSFMGVITPRLTKDIEFDIHFDWDYKVKPKTDLALIQLDYEDLIGTKYNTVITLRYTQPIIVWGPVEEGD